MLNKKIKILISVSITCSMALTGISVLGINQVLAEGAGTGKSVINEIQVAQDTGDKTQAIQAEGSEVQVLKDTEDKTQALKDIGSEGQVSQDTGDKTKAAQGEESKTQASKDTEDKTQVLKDVGSESQVSQDTGDKTQAVQGEGSEVQVSKDTGDKSQVPKDVGSEVQVPQDNGNKAQVSQDTGIDIKNTTLKSKLAAAAGKGSDYTGSLTADDLATIKGTIDLSNSNITDDDMPLMKYLTGVSEIKLSNNIEITYKGFNKENFDWTTAKSLDFSGCTGIKLLPTANYGMFAFADCNNLTSINLPEGIETIPIGCFMNCSALTTVKIPNTVVSIRKTAFKDCTSLSYIKIPSNVKKLEDNCFSGCTNISILDVRDTSFTRDNTKTIGYSDSTILLCGQDAKLTLKEASIKKGETQTITSEIPSEKNVTWVSSNTNVAEVSSSGVVTGVNSGTAYIYVKTEDNSYSGLCVVTVADNTSSIIKVTGISLDKTSASLKEGETVEIIATISPEEATNKKVTWTSSDEAVATVDAKGKVTAVKAGKVAVTAVSEDNKDVKAQCVVTISPKDVAGIDIKNTTLKSKLAVAAGKGSDYTGSLTEDDLAAIKGIIDLSDSNITDKDMPLMKYLKGVSAINLSNNKDITYVSFKKLNFDWTTPKSLDFSGCTGIRITSNSNYGTLAFTSCKNLTSINLPDGISVVPTSCFMNCTALTNVKIPDKVVSIKVNAFAGCTSLSDVEIPKNVKTLEGSCFKGCTSLTYIKIPSNVETLKDNCFSGCTNLSILDARDTSFNRDNTKTIGYPDSTVLLCGQDGKLSLKETTIKTGGTQTITTAIPLEKNVIWGSTNTNVATVSSGGVVTGLNPGISYIYAKAEDDSYSGLCIVKVTDNTSSVIKATGMSLDKTSASLKEGETVEILATITPEDATNKNVIWTSSDEKIATVDAKGKITAVKAGTATITAVSEDNKDVKAQCAITVSAKDEVKSIQITNQTVESIVKLGSDAKVSVKAVNNSNKDQNAVLIIALYDEAGNFVSYASGEDAIKEGNYSVLDAKMTLPTEGTYKLKAFVCEDLKDMTPISNIIDIPVESNK